MRYVSGGDPMTDFLPKLHSLDGADAPAELGPALRQLAELSHDEQTKFHEILNQILEQIPEDQLDNRIVRFCRRAELDAKKMVAPLKAVRFLFMVAGVNNVEPALLRDDLAALCPEVPLLGDVLMPSYQSALPKMREALVTASLHAHGRVLTGMEWRLDTMGSSSRGRDLNFPVALLTLHYQDRQEPGSFTIQLLPSMVQELSSICKTLLGS